MSESKMSALLESFEDVQEFRLFPKTALRLKKDVLAEILSPCSRFKGVFIDNKDIDVKVSQLMHRFDAFEDDALIPVSGGPMNWRFLVRYLHAQNITSSLELYIRNNRNDAPKIHGIRLAPAPKSSIEDGENAQLYGYGSGSTLDESISKAVGEHLERYFLAQYKYSALQKASFKELSSSRHNALSPLAFNGFLDWQKKRFPSLRVDENTPLSWVEGNTLSGNKKILLPAQAIFWNFSFRGAQKEQILLQPNTNGAAGGFTTEEAVLGGILEIIERDGFLIYWLNSIAPRQIDVSTIKDEEFQEKLAYLNRYNVSYYFLDTTTDTGIPSCICALTGATHGEYVVTLGGSSGFAVEKIVKSALREALSIYAFNDKELTQPPQLPDNYEPFTDSHICRDERIALWRSKEMYERFLFFVSGKMESVQDFMRGVEVYQTPSEQLLYVRQRFEQLGEGYDIYYHSVTHTVLERLGYNVVKVLIPRMMHMYLNEDFATLDAPRLREVPVKLGYKPCETLNPWPHPFP